MNGGLKRVARDENFNGNAAVAECVSCNYSAACANAIPQLNQKMSRKRNRIENLFELELLLLERPRTQSELVAHFAVNRKTVRRAVDALSSYRAISEERRGRHVVYKCEEFESPVITPFEIAALVLSQEAIKATGKLSPDSPFARGAASLLKKVREKLSPFMRRKLDSLSAVVGSAGVPAKDFSAHRETIEILIHAAEDKRQTELRYRSLTSNRISRRRFDPFAVYFDPDGATLKVIGRDHRRREIIPFSIDRIEQIVLTKDFFERPADFELNRFLAENCFNGIHGAPLTVRLKAFGTTARIFAERQFHPSQKIIAEETEADGQVATTIEMRVAGGRGLERFVLSWLPEIEVVAPAELRRQIAKIQQTALSRNASNKF